MDNIVEIVWAMHFPMENPTACCNDGNICVDNCPELPQEILEIINSDETS